MTEIMESLIVAVAPNGARRTKADHPRLPLTAGEIAAEAVACRDAGAAMLHLHVRDAEGRHSLDPGAYREAIAAVRAAVGDDLIIQVTSEAAGRYAAPEQMAMVRAIRPEAVSLAIRELVPEAAHERTAAAFFAEIVEGGTVPQYILYDASDVRRFADLRARGVVPGARPFVLFVLGRYATGRAAHPRDLVPFLAAWADDGPWALCAFGAAEHACATAAAALGGHVRVGFENNLALADGSRAPDNAALVSQIAETAGLLGRPLADAATARAMLADPVAAGP